MYSRISTWTGADASRPVGHVLGLGFLGIDLAFSMRLFYFAPRTVLIFNNDHLFPFSSH